MKLHEIPLDFMRFYDVSVNWSAPTETNRGLTSYTDLCVFINNAGLIILACVDDLVRITQTTAEMAKLQAQLFGKFKCHNLGSILYYLGICICHGRTKCTIELSIKSYIDKLGMDFSVNAPCCYHPLAVKALNILLQAKYDIASPQLT
jgi:hypothetical protein